MSHAGEILAGKWYTLVQAGEILTVKCYMLVRS